MSQPGFLNEKHPDLREFVPAVFKNGAHSTRMVE